MKHLDSLTMRAGFSPEQRLALRAVATVLPFRTNEYVVEQLIDWSAAPDDPIYRLVWRSTTSTLTTYQRLTLIITGVSTVASAVIGVAGSVIAAMITS